MDCFWSERLKEVEEKNDNYIYFDCSGETLRGHRGYTINRTEVNMMLILKFMRPDKNGHLIETAVN